MNKDEILNASTEMQRYIDLCNERNKRIKYIEDTLRKISEFGRNNPGCGYSCAKIAEKALKND